MITRTKKTVASIVAILILLVGVALFVLISILMYREFLSSTHNSNKAFAITMFLAPASCYAGFWILVGLEIMGEYVYTQIRNWIYPFFGLDVPPMISKSKLPPPTIPEIKNSSSSNTKNYENKEKI